MPYICRVIISDLDPIRGMRSRCREIMHGSQRLDGHGFLFETVCAMHAKMHLLVPRDHLFKQCQPIDIPTSEDRADRKSTRLNSSHLVISYAVFCLTKKNNASEKSNLFNSTARMPPSLTPSGTRKKRSASSYCAIAIC